MNKYDLHNEFSMIEKELEGNPLALLSLENIKIVIGELDFERQVALRKIDDLIYEMSNKNEKGKKI